MTTSPTPATTSAHHDLKAGFAFQRIDANVIRNTSGGQIVELLDPLPDDPLQRPVYTHTFFASLDSTVENPSIAPVVATPQNDVLAAFIQDRWQILSNLTVNAGVRWEKQLIRASTTSPTSTSITSRRASASPGTS